MLKKIEKTVSWLLMLLIAATLVWLLVSRMTGSEVSLFGYSIFRIKTGSMEPDLMIGDVILVKETDASELDVGMDITFISKAPSTQGMTITHRIVEKPVETDDGRYMIITRGIIEGATDDPAMYDDQLIGRVVCKLHVLSWVYSLFSTKVGLLIVLLPLAAIIFYEGKVLVRALCDKDNKEGQDEQQNRDS